MNFNWRWVALLLLAFLAGCVHKPVKKPTPVRPPAPITKPTKPAEDGRPHGTPDISKIPEPIPKAESRSKYGNKSPYKVLGQTYRVLPTSKGYVERGIASWYGTKFHGQNTSVMESYDMYKFTAAHKTLPLPSYARVTNLENGRSIVVRVNDRGPFSKNRLIDLSYVAAIKLGISGRGTGLVEVRGLDPKSPAKSSSPAVSQIPAEPATSTKSASNTKPAFTTKNKKDSSAATESVPLEPSAESEVGVSHPPRIYLQVGAYSDHSNAERAAAILGKAKMGQVRIVSNSINAGKVHRVRVGPLPNVETADALTTRIEKLGLGRPHVALDD